MRDKLTALNELVRGHKYVNAEDGFPIDAVTTESLEKKYAFEIGNNLCCDWILHRIKELEEN